MDYEGPTADDLDNVRALNRCFLELYSGSGAPGCGGLGSRRLPEAELKRLSAAPFLLFSFHESDGELWGRVLGDDPQLDLCSTAGPRDMRLRELTATALSFIWQLSRRNPFAARVISGAPVTWCLQLANVTLMTLAKCVAGRADMLVPRFHDRDDVWRRLLGSGVSARRQLQLMSHQSAMQFMLTRQHKGHERLAAAACRFGGPKHRVADTREEELADSAV